jgi:hypothetical protein
MPGSGFRPGKIFTAAGIFPAIFVKILGGGAFFSKF